MKDKHNFYLDRLKKLELYKKLRELGLPALSGSAAIRALINIFIEGGLDHLDMRTRIEQEVIITPTDKRSKL